MVSIQSSGKSRSRLKADTEIEYCYVKGITRSDRLGEVLSVDFSPRKVCSFDCIYCGIGRTTDKTTQRRAFYPVKDVYGEIRGWVDRNHLPDYALLTGSGEPTLYRHLGRLVRLIHSGIPELKTLIYTNGSLLHSPKLRQDISALDLVFINLNSTDEDIFRQICRPHRNVRLDRTIDGIKSFREEYNGLLWMDVVLIKGVNTQENTLERLVNTISDIAPDRYLIRGPRSTDGDRAKQKRIVIPERLKEKWRHLPFEIDYDT